MVVVEGRLEEGGVAEETRCESVGERSGHGIFSGKFERENLDEEEKYTEESKRQ